MKRENRSDKYQYLICEVVCSDELLGSFTNGDSLAYRLNPYQYDERTYELQDELKKIFWETVDACMTERQKIVLKKLAAGQTQQEIADELGVNQSSITKSLNGNIDYKHGNTKVYGGCVKKLQKIFSEHTRVQEILIELSELQNEKL